MTLSVDATFTLVASVYPEGATDQDVIWSSSNEDVATVDEDGVVTAIALGTATITAKSANGASAKCKVIVDSPVIDVTSVTLDKTSLTLLVDSTYTLVATIAPDTASYQDITWSSSDEKVATVDKDGFVTAIAAGTATITAQSTNEEVSAVCEVTVNAPIDVTSISFGEISLVMEVASTQTVVVNVLPTDATYTDIIWSSSDEEVATVEDGVVTAVAAGTAIIRAEAMYGVSAEFVLTVNEPAEE